MCCVVCSHIQKNRRDVCKYTYLNYYYCIWCGKMVIKKNDFKFQQIYFLRSKSLIIRTSVNIRGIYFIILRTTTSTYSLKRPKRGRNEKKINIVSPAPWHDLPKVEMCRMYRYAGDVLNENLVFPQSRDSFCCAYYLCVREIHLIEPCVAFLK